MSGLACMPGITIAKSVFTKPTIPLQTSEVDNLIIGTGYGGAVAALRLAQAGKKVTMLEMGLDWNKLKGKYLPFSKLTTPTSNSTWLRNTTIAPFMNVFSFSNKFTGVLDRMDFENVKIYAGRGVGGGSIANGGMAVLPKQDYFREVFPDLDSEIFWQKYFPLAQNELGVNQIAEQYLKSSKYYQFARVGLKEAANAGFNTITVPNVYSFDYMQREEMGLVQKSALNKEVIYGNNHGKKSLDKTYLKKALQTGLVTILDLHKVNFIESLPADKYKVHIDVIDTSGETLSQKIITCNALYINAGSIGTTELLLKSQARGYLKNLDNNAGKYWGNNGNIMTGRNMVNTAFNTILKPLGTGSKQSTIPVAGIDNWHDKQHPFFAEISPLPMDMEVYTALYLIINRVPKLGSLSYNNQSAVLNVNWNQSNYANALKNAKYFVDAMNKANGGTSAGLLFDKGFGPDICYHPLGGAVLGKACDEHGRVKGYKNLYITDGSLIPGTIGVNPFLTITALAEYCMNGILKEDYRFSVEQN